uniref:SH3 domain-containing protein n=1 Tax=Clytia hemisphaerica TaxID=252671 RepID=A0A7M5V7G2_9CNID
MGSDFSKTITDNKEWAKCILALNIHGKNGLLRVMHNDTNDPLYQGLPRNEQQLYQFFDKYRKKLNGLKNSGALKKDQFDLLLPASGKTSSLSFDITLIVFVIINFVNITPPKGGWRIKEPKQGDFSVAAFIIALRQLRNKILHGALKEFKDQNFFKGIWAEIRAALVGINYNCLPDFDSLLHDKVVVDIKDGKNHMTDLVEDLKKTVQDEMSKQNKDMLLTVMKEVDKKVKELQNQRAEEEDYCEEEKIISVQKMTRSDVLFKIKDDNIHTIFTIQCWRKGKKRTFQEIFRHVTEQAKGYIWLHVHLELESPYEYEFFIQYMDNEKCMQEIKEIIHLKDGVFSRCQIGKEGRTLLFAHNDGMENNVHQFELDKGVKPTDKCKAITTGPSVAKSIESFYERATKYYIDHRSVKTFPPTYYLQKTSTSLFIELLNGVLSQRHGNHLILSGYNPEDHLNLLGVGSQQFDKIVDLVNKDYYKNSVLLVHPDKSCVCVFVVIDDISKLTESLKALNNILKTIYFASFELFCAEYLSITGTLVFPDKEMKDLEHLMHLNIPKESETLFITKQELQENNSEQWIDNLFKTIRSDFNTIRSKDFQSNIDLFHTLCGTLMTVMAQTTQFLPRVCENDTVQVKTILLNGEQIECITNPAKHKLIKACFGSGKTVLLIEMIRSILKEKDPKNVIIFLSYDPFSALDGKIRESFKLISREEKVPDDHCLNLKAMSLTDALAGAEFPVSDVFNLSSTPKRNIGDVLLHIMNKHPEKKVHFFVDEIPCEMFVSEYSKELSRRLNADFKDNTVVFSLQSVEKKREIVQRDRTEKSSEIDIESTGMTLLKLTKTMRMSRTLHDLKEILEKEIESTSYSIPLEMKKKEEEDNDKDIAKVIFDYEAEECDELNIKVGDIITGIREKFDGWMEGEVNGKRGLFPVDFVEVAPKEPTNFQSSANSEGAPFNVNKNKPKQLKKKIVRVLYDYKPVYENVLALSVGDFVEVVEEIDDGWWKGRQGDQEGMFPSNYVELVVDQSQESLESLNQVTFEVVSDYTANMMSDELNLKVGDIVSNVGKENDGWLEGEVNGKRGMFPGNVVTVKDSTHIQLIDDEPQEPSKNLNPVGFEEPKSSHLNYLHDPEKILKTTGDDGSYEVVKKLNTSVKFVDADCGHDFPSEILPRLFYLDENFTFDSVDAITTLSIIIRQCLESRNEEGVALICNNIQEVRMTEAALLKSKTRKPVVFAPYLDIDVPLQKLKIDLVKNLENTDNVLISDYRTLRGLEVSHSIIIVDEEDVIGPNLLVEMITRTIADLDMLVLPKMNKQSPQTTIQNAFQKFDNQKLIHKTIVKVTKVDEATTSVELQGNGGEIEHLETLALTDEDRKRFEEIKKLTQDNEQLQESIRKLISNGSLTLNKWDGKTMDSGALNDGTTLSFIDVWKILREKNFAKFEEIFQQNPNIVNSLRGVLGRTLLMWAVDREDRFDVFVHLMNYPQDFSLVSNGGLNVLHFVGEGGTVRYLEKFDQQTIKMLINGRHIWNGTPLHCAASYNKHDVTRWLLAKGANHELENNFGQRPDEQRDCDGVTKEIFRSFRSS